MRWAEQGLSPIKACLIAIVLMVVATYFIFTKELPFTHHYTLKAVAHNSNLLAPGSPVRIGGATVGKVTSTGRYGNTDLALITMQIDDTSQEIHSDATIAIRPRLFLEGNFYVQLAPGTPAAPAMKDGGTIPADHTVYPVQVDQVLGALPSDIRHGLQQTLQGFGQALDTRPTTAENAHLDPAVRGLTGAEAINKTFDTSVQSLRDSAIVSEALPGPQGRSLSRVVSGFARASQGLADADGQLTSFISDFDTTLQATAAEQQGLRLLVSQLGPTAHNANAAFGALDAAFPATEQFADDVATGLPQLPPTINAAYPWLAQTGPLLSKSELRGLLDDLQPAAARSGAADPQRTPVPAGDRRLRSLHEPGVPAHRQHRRQGRAAVERNAELPGVLVRDDRSGGGRAGRRRQRELPAGRRCRRSVRGRDRPDQLLRQRRHRLRADAGAPAEHPACVSQLRPAPAAERPLLDAAGAERQRTGVVRTSPTVAHPTLPPRRCPTTPRGGSHEPSP